ncbi:hypothetical protein LJK87_07575 [Paenibacillus sp. P25]|nr:hypothetical protein LJK87_07575 [Paenibacillus sp. P25]
MKSGLSAAIILVLMIALSGCMYPNELKKQNQIASGEYIVLVQNAIDQYKAKTGVLPIKNSDEMTPLYEKYPIDFSKLRGRYLSEVPANAFENGGSAMYVLVDAETKPTVKMMDLTSFQQTVELQKQIDDYKARTGESPFGEPVAKGFHFIDFDKLKMKPEQVRSVYSPQQMLPFLLHDSGRVTIDYAPEIMKLIDKEKLQSKLDGSEDLREPLVKESPFVPARSYAYRWQNGTPVPITAP